MKNIILVILVICSAVVFYSCKSDTPVTSNNSGTLTGSWTVDKVQLVSAPNNGTASAMMKSALVPFGEISASTAGYLDFNFGGERLSSTSTNLLNSPGDIIFYGSTGYNHSYDSKFKVSTDGGVTWTEKTLPGASVSFSRITATVSATILYTMYDSAYYTGPAKLFKSTNAGTSWFVVNQKMPFDMNSTMFNYRLNFINENIGFGYGADSLHYPRVFKTINGGVNWAPVSASTRDFLRMRFFDENNGYADSYTATNYRFALTHDGGLTWTQHTIADNFTPDAFYFINQSTGWTYGYIDNEPVLYKTRDGGVTWTKVSGGIEINGFTFKNDNEGYAANPFAMLKTTDGGANWIPYYNYEFSNPRTAVLINNEPVFIGYNSKLYKPTGVNDENVWSASGKLLNTAMQLITGDNGDQMFANGTFVKDISGEINFVTSVYSKSNRNSTGGGLYSFDSGYLYITLNLPNSEVWKIKLRQR